MLKKNIIISASLVAALIAIVAIVLVVPDKSGSEESGTEVLTVGQQPSEKVSIEPYLKRLRTYEQEGRYEEAIAEGEKALEIDPEDERVYSALRAMYTLAGRYTEALKLSEQLLEIAESKGLSVCGYLRSHAAILEYADRQNEAIGFLEGYRERCPKQAEGLISGLQEAKSTGGKFFPSLPTRH